MNYTRREQHDWAGQRKRQESAAGSGPRQVGFARFNSNTRPVPDSKSIHPLHYVYNQRVAYRIGNLSNAEISDFFVYRIVYRIEPPISNISIFSKPMIFLSFFAENSKNSPKIPRKFRKPMNQSRQQQQQRRKFQKFAENSENSPKIRRKFLKKKVFFEALIKKKVFL